MRVDYPRYCIIFRFGGLPASSSQSQFFKRIRKRWK
jgi:hypothetical protein